MINRARKHVELSGIIMVAVMLVVPMSAIAGGAQEEAPDEEVSLLIWHQEQPSHRIERFQEIFDEFMEEYPNIQVEQQVQTWGEAYARTMSAIQAGREPDLLFATPDFAADIRRSGAVQPVDDYISRLGESYTIYDQALNPYRHGGNYWAVPLFGMNQLLYYRASVFEEAGLDPDSPPETWDELLDYIDILVESGVVEHGMGVPASQTLAGDQLIYSLLITNRAEHLLSEDQQSVVFDNPRTVETYEFWQKLYETSPPGSLGWEWVETQTALINKNTAFGMILGGFLLNWHNQADDRGDLRAAFIPQSADGQPGTYYASNAVMLLSDDSQKQDAALTLLEYLYRPDVMGRFLNAQPGLFLPVTAEAAESETFWEGTAQEHYREIVELMIEQSQYGALYGFTHDEVNPNIGRVGGQHILIQVGQRMVEDGLSAEEAVSWGAEQIRRAID